MPHEKTPDTGEALYRRFLCGDKDAFTELVGLYEQELSFYINGMVHDYFETKHLVIETFAQLAANGNFEGKSSLKTYLFAIARNLTATFLKKRQRYHFISLDEILEMAGKEGESPELFLEREENRQWLRTAMQKLKTEHCEVLTLLYFEDMSYAEAGTVMKKSVKQISDLVYRAKSALKRILESEADTHV